MACSWSPTPLRAQSFSLPDSWRPHRSQPAGLLRPCDFPGKNTEWAVIFSSKRSSQPLNLTGISCISCIGQRTVYHSATREAPLTPCFPLIILNPRVCESHDKEDSEKASDLPQVTPPGPGGAQGAQRCAGAESPPVTG